MNKDIFQAKLESFGTKPTHAQQPHGADADWLYGIIDYILDGDASLYFDGVADADANRSGSTAANEQHASFYLNWIANMRAKIDTRRQENDITAAEIEAKYGEGESRRKGRYVDELTGPEYKTADEMIFNKLVQEARAFDGNMINLIAGSDTFVPQDYWTDPRTR